MSKFHRIIHEPTLNRHIICHKGWNIAFENGSVASDNVFFQNLSRVKLVDNCNSNVMQLENLFS